MDTSTTKDSLSLLNTVKGNMKKYTKREIYQEKLAIKIHGIIGYPSQDDYIRIVEGNMLRNCPIRKSDILIAESIFGPSIASLKGKIKYH